MNPNNLGPRIIFTLAGGKIAITESTCYSIILATILAILGIWLGSGLKKIPKGKQVIAEAIVSWVYNFAEENLGKEDGRRYAPFLGTLIIWLIFANSLGLLGLRPITADIDITTGIAIVSFVVIQVGALKKLGPKGRLDEMCDPYVFMFPMDIISAIVLPVTLALRLFGNIFGGMIVVDMWLNFMGGISDKLCGVPFLRIATGIPLNLFFDIFEPLVQAYIFVILTAANLKSARAGINPETVRERQEKKRLKRERKAAKKARASGDVV